MSVRDIVIIVILVELGLHYFPWRMLIRRKLPRPVAYTLGLGGIMVPFSLWLMDRDQIEILQTMWIVIISAGFTVFALYGLDRYLDLEKKEVEAGQVEVMLKKLIKEVLDERQGK